MYPVVLRGKQGQADCGLQIQNLKFKIIYHEQRVTYRSKTGNDQDADRR